MYVPEWSAMDPETVERFLAGRPVGELVTVRPAGAPDATTVPYLLDGGRVVAHLSRSNDHWRRIVDGSSGLLVVTGPDAYVSPSWYATKAEHGRVVPTWNYVSVHVRGAVRVHDDVDWVLDAVTRLTERHESGRERPWSVHDAPEKWVRTRARAVVGIEIVVESVEGRAKLSQNRSTADREGVVAGLRAEGTSSAAHVADSVSATLPD